MGVSKTSGTRTQTPNSRALFGRTPTGPTIERNGQIPHLELKFNFLAASVQRAIPGGELPKGGLRQALYGVRSSEFNT